MMATPAMAFKSVCPLCRWGWCVFRIQPHGKKPARESLVLNPTFCRSLRRSVWRVMGRSCQQNGLDLRTRESVLKGGESGPAVEPGSVGESLLYEKVKRWVDAAGG